MLKYQIFISSTYEDLKPERDQVIKAILEMGHIPVGMEMFSAADDQQWDIIRKQINESDYYVVLVAHRYGSMDGNVSYTEKEYDYAVTQKLPVLGFILDPDVEWPADWIENNKDIKKRLDNFRAKVSSRMVSFWKGGDDVYGKCSIALVKAFSAHPREGWVRASLANTAEMSEEITRLSRDNRVLREEVEQRRFSEIEQNVTKVDEIIDAMRLNDRTLFVWEQGAKDWGDEIASTLLEIFEAVAPDLLDEASNKTMANSLGLVCGKKMPRSNQFAVPNNFIKSYLADFASLDLIGTSTKRHSVNDTKSYWTLTEFGKQVHGRIRKNELLKGLTEFDETPEESDEENETDSDSIINDQPG